MALVERVRASAARGARESLEALAATVPVPIASIAIRACPTLPPTTEERIADNRAQTVADSVMYREALATAAEARGWSVHWYDRERVFRDAAAALGREDIDAFLQRDGSIDRAALAGEAQARGSCGACDRGAARAAIDRRLTYLAGSNRAIAEDIVQEAFVRSLDRGDEIRDSVVGAGCPIVRDVRRARMPRLHVHLPRCSLVSVKSRYRRRRSRRRRRHPA